jgi:preprotein translocase subunit YajC
MKKLVNAFLFAQLFLLQGVAFAQDGDAPPRDTGLMQTLSMIVVAMVFFYFILWRPEQKRRKEMEDQRGKLKKGDKVTAMGIVGTVSKILDQTVIVRMVDGSKIEFLKGAITEVVPATDEEAKRAEKEG